MIEIIIDKMNPSSGINHPVMYELFNFRKSGNFSGHNVIGIAEVMEPIWWNRPYQSDELVKKEADGLWSYNIPYIYGVENFKTQYNALLGVNTIPICAQFRITDKMDHNKLNDMLLTTIYRALLALGVDDTRLTFIHNDILYDGKKFVGEEHNIKDGIFTANVVLTTHYKPEEAIFKRLTGEHAFKRQITGIVEETELFTKQELMNEVKHQLEIYIKEELE